MAKMEITYSRSGRKVVSETGIEQNIELAQLKEFRRLKQIEIDGLLIQRSALDAEIAQITTLSMEVQ